MGKKIKQEEIYGGGLDEALKINGETMETFAKSFETFFEGVGKVNHELSQFYFKRLKEDIDLSGNFARCTCPEDVAETQTKFVATMVKDYGEETQRLLTLATNIAKDGFTAASPPVPPGRKVQ